jgi:hypothetical protein
VDRPEPYRSLIEHICAADVQRFEQDPGLTSFQRPYEPGQVWPFQPIPEPSMVRVRWVGPGLRTGEPVWLDPVIEVHRDQRITCRGKRTVADQIPVGDAGRASRTRMPISGMRGELAPYPTLEARMPSVLKELANCQREAA